MKLAQSKEGFTLVEALITVSLSFLVFATLFTVYYWAVELTTLVGKKNRSQVAAANSSVRIMDCIRNASTVSDIDEVSGRWVELTYPDGEVATISYTDSVDTENSGALALLRDGEETIWFVDSGVTEMMGSQGFDSVVFSVNSSTNVVYVRYRISQPAPGGGRDLNDQNYAMHIRFATCLRNAGSNALKED